jgi:hypothetical protein
MRNFLALGLVLGAGAFLFHCSDQENPKGVVIPPDDIFDAGGDGYVAPAKPEQPHKNNNPQPKITECKGTPVESSGSAVCAVTSPGAADGTKVIRGNVLGPEEVLHGGEVLIDATGLIVCAACDCSAATGYANAAVISCPDGVITPGLVNPHEHLTFQNNKPIVHADKYENRSDWQGARGHTALDYASKANQLTIAYGELRYVMGGATSIAGGGGVPGLLRDLDTSADELEGLPAEVGFSDTFPLGTPGKNLATGCDYSSPRSAFLAQQTGEYIPHISEGIDPEAHNEFTCLSIDGDKNDLVMPNTAIIHAVALTPDNAVTIRKNNASVVWSPRSNVDLYGNTAQAVMLDMAGVPLSLGSDWVPSGSMNMLRELKCADSWNQTYFDKHFTDADLWRMATMNGAFAVGAANVTGMLKKGYEADIAVFDGRKDKDFRAIINAGVEDVSLVLRGGAALYGDDALMNDAALKPTDPSFKCSPFPNDVCGVPKSVCVDVSISSKPDLAAIMTEGTKYYPLFFCKDQTPTDEPSCHPARPKIVRGSTVYDGNPTDADKDGDGIPNTTDNCPAIFNPVRPMDGGHQADADNDGIGDACDECPGNPNQSCDHLVAGDMDGDTIANGIDNCPRDANTDQADSDTDGEGDACDYCTGQQIAAQGCPLKIASIRDPSAPDHPKNKSVVSAEGYISARTTGNYLYLQDDVAADKWKGILIAADALAAATITVGQKARIVGVHGNPFDQDQITSATVTITNATAAAITPLDVAAGDVNTAAKAAAEPYEGVYVRVAGPLTILNDNVNNATNPSGTIAYELTVTGSLEVNDFLAKRWGTCATTGGNPCPLPPPGFTKGTSFSTISGVMGWNFSDRKIFPRSGADFAPP